MKILKVVLKSGDPLHDIFRVFGQVSAEKIVFLCPRHFSVLSDTTFLKKLHAQATKHGKQFAFVVPQKFLVESLTSQKIEAYQTVPEEWTDDPTQDLANIFPRIKAQKNVSAKEPAVPESLSKEPVKHPDFATHRIEKGEVESSLRGKVFFGFLLVIVFLGALFLWLSPRAMVEIKPRVSALPVTQNIIVELNEGEVPENNEQLPRIPGIFVETEVTDTEVFPATGRRYDITNAKGKVTLFNETRESKYLVPSRLSTVDGVIFRFDHSITIPPRQGDVPGQYVIEIEADPYDEDGDPIGDRGNIIAGTELFFPALRDDSRELYYARANKGPLVGGSTLTHYIITEEDKIITEKALFEVFQVRGIERLREEIMQRSAREKKKYVLVNDPVMVQAELLSFSFPEERIGEESQTVEVEGSVRVSGVVFDQTEVKKFLIQKLQESQDVRKKLLHIDDLSIAYDVLESEDFIEDRWLKLSVSGVGIEILNLDPKVPAAAEWFDSLRRQVAEKDVGQARSILANEPEIDDVLAINLSPFWAKNMPKLFDQIHFKVREDSFGTTGE